MQSLIYLLRHGAIEPSSPRRFLGRTDLPLSDNGIRQAIQVGRALASIPFCRVFSSPLDRAMQTAAFVSGWSVDKITPVAPLCEINLGTWEGLSVAEVRQRFPGAYEERGRNLGTFRPEQGESFADVASRGLPALQAIARDFSGPILIIAHAGVNRVLLSRLQRLPLDDLLQIPQDYCGVNILVRENNGLRVAVTNQILY